MSEVPALPVSGRPRPLRPSSAGGKLQTHESFYSSLLDVRRPSGVGELPKLERRRRPLTASHLRSSEPRASSPRHDEQQRARRPTITTAEDALRLTAHQKCVGVHRLLGDSLKGRLEDKLDLRALDSLKKAFHAAGDSGDGTLDLEEFKLLLKKKLRLPISKEAQVEALFDKIDWSSEGAISWNEFCTYMQVEFAEKEDSHLRTKEVAFNLPALSEMTPHRNEVVRIANTADGSFIVLSIDGLFSFWSSNCTIKKARSIITSEQSQRMNTKWITDFAIMAQYNKIVVTTGDRELEFFEQSSFEPYCCISGLETIPLKLTYHTPKDNVDECLIIFGDRQGCINILLLHATGECLRTWKKYPKSEGVPTVSLDVIVNSSNVEFIRWKVHNDWISELKYEPFTNQTISCSNDDSTAVVIGSIRGSTNIDASLKELLGPSSGRASHATLVGVASAVFSGSVRLAETPQTGVTQVPTGTSVASSVHPAALAGTATGSVNTSYNMPKPRLESDQLVFKIYKGAKTFAYCYSRNIMVSGGMDHIIRSWNPYVPSKPTGFLRGHTTPIVYLSIDENENRLFSVSSDKCVKVWDLMDLSCLLTIRPKAHQIRGDLQCCHISHESRTLCIATDQMSMLNLKLSFRRKVQFRVQAYLQPQMVVDKLNDLDYLAAHYAGGAVPVRLQETGVDLATGKVSLHNENVPLMRTEVVLSHKEPVSICRFNPVRKHIVSCSEGSIIKVWDIESGSQIFECGEAHGDAAITCACFDMTGRRLVTGGRDGCLRLWNYINGHCLQKLCKEKHNAEITGVTYVEMNKNRYIISVGWDKAINVYNDNVHESIRQVNRPLPRWTDDEAHGHQEDILAITDCPPNFLATSSYDGQVIVWNMISGHVMVHLNARPPPNYTDDAIDGDLSIGKLSFIKSRILRRSEGVLVASGPRAHIHIWSIFHGGKLMAQFKPDCAPKQSQICGLAVGDDDTMKATLLVAADQLGYVYVWNITDYARNEVETSSPPLYATWRAHTESVTGLEYSAEHHAVVSASSDCTVRLWTQEGHYIGTFGQPNLWNVYDTSTFQHPMVPYDILVDPNSLPTQLRSDRNGGGRRQPPRRASARTPRSSEQLTPLSTQSTFVDDDAIEDLIRHKMHRLGQGKRLRHEILKPTIVEHGGPNNYQHLVCFELDQPKKIGEPLILSNKKRHSFIID